MRRALSDAGRIALPGANVALRMAQGVHAGRFHFFAVGTSHVELLPAGPAWTRLVHMEHEASAGEILVSPDTAALLPGRCAGAAKGPGILLAREPTSIPKMPLIARPKMDAEMLTRCLSPSIRAHVQGGGGTPEHRPVTIAFLRFEGTDALVDERGAAAAADALHQLVRVVETAATEQQIAFLASDVDADGGKLILTAGAPRVIGDDEERMLLAMRAVLDRELPIRVRIGVHRGAVFAGDIGPFYRRTYTVMGDAVNLAARLMAEARPGQIYATADVLDRCDTLFETIELPPLRVKGKAKAVRAWSVGRAKGSRGRDASLQRLPLLGRDAELKIVREALASARAGSGRLIEIVGEPGVGKTRLLEALRDDAPDFRPVHGVCEAYTAAKPYSVCSELLRELMHFGRDDDDAVVLERLRAEVAARAPELEPWLPLIAIAFDVEAATTPEVELLAEKNRRAKLNEVVARFLEVLLPQHALIEIENGHHMDAASAELLAYLARGLGERPWVVGIARRPASAGFEAPTGSPVVKIELAPLGAKDALQMTQAQAEQHPLPPHVLETVAKRSGGNPQFLRDLLRAAMDSGGAGGLPDSAEAAAMARIDALDPEDRALVRRAAVFGLTFHPRMLSWLYESLGETAPGPGAWASVQELFDEEPDGYVRFRRPLLRDAAYEGLPYRLRRKLHSAVAVHLEEEMDDPQEAASILSLHHLEAGQYPLAWRYAAVAGKRAHSGLRVCRGGRSLLARDRSRPPAR